MFFFIYKTTNIQNLKFYIGMHQTSNLDDGYLGSGKLLQLAISKYGRENFVREILFMCSSAEEMREKEREIITEVMIQSTDCYNLVPGGWGGSLAAVNSNPELKTACSKVSGSRGATTRNKIRNERRKTDPVYDAEIRQQLLEMSQKARLVNLGRKGSFKGRKHSVQAKAKISAITSKAQSGSGNSQYGTKWVCHLAYGAKKISIEDVEKHLTDGWFMGRTVKNKQTNA